MKKNLKYNSQPEFKPEIQEMISRSAISWTKTKEEIWEELWGKTKSINSIEKKGETITIRLMKYAAAALLTLLVGISSAMYFYTKTIETSLTSQSEVILPDNSVVALSVNSSLSYKPVLWKIYRKVNLEGEGLFTVHKGSRFEVVSKKGKTSVLGTSFIVYARNNEYQITCLSGKVKVIEFSKQNEAIIKGGQKAILQADGNFNIIESETNKPELQKSSRTERLDAELNAVLSNDPGKNTRINGNKVINDRITDNTNLSVASDEISPGSQPEFSNTPVKAVPDDNQSDGSVQTITDKNEQDQNQTSDNQNMGPNNTSSASNLRNSLTKGQISILENQKMSREEKKKAFLESLSSEQKRMLDEQLKEQAKQESENTEARKNEELKEEQKMQFQEQIRQGSGKENIQNKAGGDNIRPIDNGPSVKENNTENKKGN